MAAANGNSTTQFFSSNGSSKLDFTPHGIRWELTIPASHVVPDPDQPIQEYTRFSCRI